MPTTTWRVARREIMRPLGLVEMTSSTNIATDTVIVSTGVAQRFNQDDHFNGWHSTVVLDADGGTPANGLGTATRRVTDYTGSSGTFAVSAAWGSAEDEDVDVDLYLFHPTDILRAYNRARQFPGLSKQIGIVRDIETIVTGPLQVAYTLPSTIRNIRRIDLGERHQARPLAENLFLNADFEDWADPTTADNWSIAGSGATVNQEKQTSPSSNYAVLSESNSARVIVPSSVVTTLLQTVDSASSDYPAVAMEGMEVNVSGWVYSNTASRVSIRIAGGDGTAHSGTGWEYIKHAANLDATATSVAAGLVGSSGAAIPAFVDEMILVVGPSEVLEHPYSPIHNWEHVPPVAGASNGGIIRFTEHLPNLHRLRIVGTDLLSGVSVDTDTIEVDGDLLEPVYNKAREFLCQERYLETDDTKWRDKATEFRGAFEEQMQYTGVGMPLRRFKLPDRVF